MRIVYITDTHEIGGAERYLANLAEQVAKHGHDVLIFAPQDELVAWFSHAAPSISAARAFDDDYHYAPTLTRRTAALLALAPRLTRLLRKLAPDVVHVNNGGFPGSDLCRIALPAARLAGVGRRLMTVHSNPWPRDRMADPSLQAIVDRLTWSSTHAVIAPSEAVARGLTYRRGMSRNLGRTIYYGVGRPDHDPRLVNNLRRRLASAGELLVGMVSARPVAEKGYGVFIDALATLGDRVRGVVVGPPPPDLAARASGAGLQLTIAGRRENVGDYYAAFDVLVVPSTDEECMPLVILEAASVRTPTFGSRLSGIPEAITDGVDGRLFEPGSARELAELIASAETDRSGTATMGRAAQERWRRQFQLDTMTRSTLALYGEVLSERGGRRRAGSCSASDARGGRPRRARESDPPRA